MGTPTIEDRPVVHGLPVPYVASWTQEHWGRTQKSDPIVGIENPQNGRLIVAYRDEGPNDRDRQGVLWWRNGLGGGGEPEFGQINAPRYRRCITRCCCQVCGKSVSKECTPWIVPENEWNADDGPTGLFLTTNPPTCQDCWEPALRMCPHLRQGAHTLLVRQWSLWGVLGGVYVPPNEWETKLVSYQAPEVLQTVARQNLVHITEFEEVSCPS